MALDIHILINGKHAERVFSLNDSEFAELEDAFNLFYKRTGIRVDQYSDLKFSSGLGVLIKALNDSSDSELKTNLVEILNKLEQQDKSIIFLGD